MEREIKLVGAFKTDPIQEKLNALGSRKLSLQGKVEIYKTFSDELLDRYGYRLITVATAAGDKDTVLKVFILNLRYDIMREFREYFTGVDYNREAIEFLPDILRNSKEKGIESCLFLSYLSSLAEYPKLIVHAQFIYDTIAEFLGTDRFILDRDDLYLGDLEFQFYEFLLATGYYPMSYITSLKSTPELERWLSLTTDV